MSAPPAPRLPCGADVEALLEQVADDVVPDAATAEHQRTCPFCGPALAELADSWAPLGTLDDPVDTPTPRSLDRSVMERVATHAAHGWHAAVAAHDGATRIAAWVVAVVARRAAAGVAGVHAVAGQVAPDGGTVPDVRAGFRRRRPDETFTGTAVVVSLTVTVDAGVPIPPLVAQVRRAVTRHVRVLTGLSTVRVDVHVDDLA